METLRQCPVCGSASLNFYMNVEDHSVSKETFQLQECGDCKLVFTNPRPDPHEIGKYYASAEYISHTNSKAGLMNRAYQIARNRAISGKIRLVASLGVQDTSLLDYGCGTGEFLSAAKSKGWRCAGIEPDEGARQKAIKNHALNVHSPEKLPEISSGQFSLITLWHVLEHVHSLKETVNQFRRIIRSDGALVVAVPNRNALDATRYGHFWAAYDVPRHLYHFSKKPILRLMQNAGFSCETIKPLFFDPFYISLLSNKYQYGSSGPLSAFISGIQTTIAGRRDIEKNSSLLYVFRPVE